MKKKIISLCLVVAMLATAIVGASMAYLQDEDSDVNVMTLGNVDIEQIEQERDANGDLVDFTDDKPLYPVVGDTAWDETRVSVNDTEYKVFDDTLKNVVDKIVTVKNTGRSAAYVRTIIAFEAPEGFDDNLLHINYNGDDGITMSEWSYITVGETRYVMTVFTYEAPLAAGAVSAPSLMQVFLDKTATNEDVELLGETYEILVLSQAGQVNGFENVGASSALDTMFGTVEENAATWLAACGAADTWDGTADTSWYNETDTEFVLTTSEQLAGLAELVDGGNSFAGKTITLSGNVDLYAEDEKGNRIPFNPIGHSSNSQSFNGTFDGQGHTISNMYEQSDLSAWQYEGEYYGLFAYTNGATIKNVTVADAYISSGRNEAAGVVGNAVNTTFSDITISNTTLIAYNNSAGGVAAECYGECSFTNITVDEDTVIGPLWGTYDVRLGGVVGMVSSSDKVSFSNITVACKLDAINDVASNYQWYNYRYSGMLIGQVDGVNGVADPTGYVTCENVTVIYGDWVNYHYCEDSSYGTPSYAAEGQYKFNRVEAGTGTNGIDLTTCDHDETETHNLLIVFDQLFGGGQGVSGLETYDGVTVVYPS